METSPIKKRLGNLGRTYVPGLYRLFKRVSKFTNDYLTERRLERGLKTHRLTPGTETFFLWDRYYSPHETDRRYRSGIICMYDGRIIHGGLTDRLRGLLTTYAEARKQGIPFYIHWVHPFRLEDYLVPSETDWRISADNISYSRQDSLPVVIQDCSRSVNDRRLKAALSNRLCQTHVYSNSNNAAGSYAHLFRELFRPSKMVLDELEIHRRALGSNYVSFSFRFLRLLGDFEDICGETLSSGAQEELLKRTTTELKKMVGELPQGWKALVASDSRKFLSIAPTLDSRIYVVPGPVGHVDVNPDSPDSAWRKTFVDQLLISGARKVWLMRTGKMYRSGFPSFAAEIGEVPFEEHIF